MHDEMADISSMLVEQVQQKLLKPNDTWEIDKGNNRKQSIKTERERGMGIITFEIRNSVGAGNNDSQVSVEGGVDEDGVVKGFAIIIIIQFRRWRVLLMSHSTTREHREGGSISIDRNLWGLWIGGKRCPRFFLGRRRLCNEKEMNYSMHQSLF